MKFSCTQLALSKALNTVSKAVSTRTTIPVLKGILLTVKGDKLFMRASDLDLSIETKIEILNGEDGSVVVSAKMFDEIIRRLPNALIKFEEDASKLLIKCLGSSFSIVTLSADDFPAMEMVNELNKINVDKEIFKELVRKTSFSASIDEKKGVLTGCLVEFTEGKITMVALDGFRMAVAEAESETTVNKRIVISARILNEAAKIIAESDENQIDLILDEKRVEFITKDTRIVVRLLDGEFIKYKDIIPSSCKTRTVVSRDEFLSGIERASLFSKEGKNNLVKMDIKLGNVEITSRSEEGNVKEDIAAEITGDDIVIGFNSKYIIDVLKSLSDEEVSFEMSSAVSACLIRPVEGDSYTYLILPVRITAF